MNSNPGRYQQAELQRQAILDYGQTVAHFTTLDLREALGVDIAVAQRTTLSMHRLGELVRGHDIGRKAVYSVNAVVTETVATAKAKVSRKKAGVRAANVEHDKKYHAKRMNTGEPWRTIHTACNGDSPDTPESAGQGGMYSPRMTSSMGW